MIKKTTSVLILFFVLTLSLSAQFETVTFDYELSTFNDNQPLPSETAMIITGTIPDEIQMVEVKIYTSKGRDGRDPLYQAAWKRPYNKPKGDFRVPVNYKLPSSKKYDVEINYLVRIDEKQRQEFYSQLKESLNAYIDQIFDLKKNKFELDKSPRQAIADMNELVEGALTVYRSQTASEFAGFSDIIREKMEDLKKTDILHRDSTGVGMEPLKIASLKKLLHNEVRYLLNDDLLKIADARYVEDYETDNKSGYFALSAGYGAVYLGGNINNLDYDTAPYISIGFPLSTSRIAPTFLRNSSLTLGIFLSDFENDEGGEITGPIVKKPIQVGLDYKLFQFIRFNVGAALLEENGNNNGDDSRIFVQPFIGLSAKVNLQLSFDK